MTPLHNTADSRAVQFLKQYASIVFTFPGTTTDTRDVHSLKVYSDRDSKLSGITTDTSEEQ